MNSTAAHGGISRSWHELSAIDFNLWEHNLRNELLHLCALSTITPLILGSRDESQHIDCHEWKVLRMIRTDLFLFEDVQHMHVFRADNAKQDVMVKKGAARV